MTAPTTPADFAAAINGAWRQTTDGVLATAKLYHDARESLGQAGWNDLCANVPHNDSTARKFALIGRWAKGYDALGLPTGQLPAGWGTLYTLTRVPEQALRAALASGAVHSGMERADAERLLPKTPKARVAAAPTVTAAAPTVAPVNAMPLPMTFAQTIERLLELKADAQPADYKAELPRAKLGVAVAFLTAVHKLAQ